MELWRNLWVWGRVDAALPRCEYGEEDERALHTASIAPPEERGATERQSAEEEEEVLSVVATHQLGLMLLSPSASSSSASADEAMASNVAVLFHSPEFIDVGPEARRGGREEEEGEKGKGKLQEVEVEEEAEPTRAKRQRVGQDHETASTSSTSRPRYARLRFGSMMNVRITQIAASWAHALLVDDCGALYSLGWNGYGQCGTGDKKLVRNPRRVDALASSVFPIRSVAAGEKHSLAVDGRGKTWGWGSNRFGQLGLESDVSKLKEWERMELNKESESRYKEEDFIHLIPQPLDSLINDGILVKRVYCGWNYSFVLSQLGQLFTFGWGMYGQLGHGELGNELLPRPVDLTGDTMPTDQAILNEDDQEEVVIEDEEVVECSCGVWHAAAVTQSGRLYTWGYGKDGQMGDGTRKGSSTPALVLGPLENAQVTKVCCGSRHTAVLTDSGEIYAWGNNTFGQVLPRCGDGEEDSILMPTKVSISREIVKSIWTSPWATFARSS